MPRGSRSYGKVGKIDPRFEEPLSKLYYYVSMRIAQRVRIDPNLITTARLLLMVVLTTLFFYDRVPVAVALMLQATFFLDHLDGEMARQRDMVTEFGDYYDHLVDVTYTIPLLLILFARMWRTPLFWPLAATIVAAIGASGVLVSCQEAMLSQRRSTLASPSLRTLCVASGSGQCNLRVVKYLRHVGVSFLHLLGGVAVVYVCYTRAGRSHK